MHCLVLIKLTDYKYIVEVMWQQRQYSDVIILLIIADCGIADSMM